MATRKRKTDESTNVDSVTPTIKNDFMEDMMALIEPKFRRSEDWERLTRLEYVVESLAKESSRHSTELATITKTQTDMLANLRVIKFTVLGGLAGFLLSILGAERALAFVARLFGLF